MLHHPLLTLKTAATAAMILLSTPIIHAAIIAEFKDGNSTSAVDGFTGMAGQGWYSGWEISQETEGNDNSYTVTNVNPLKPEGGNYLSVVNSAQNRQVTLSRRFESYGGIDHSKNHTVSFEFRIDDIGAWNYGRTWLRFSQADTSNPNDGFHTWYIAAEHAVGVWTVRDVNRETGVSIGVNTDIAVTEGVTYFFSIDVVPEHSYTIITISDSEGNSWVSGELGFRGASSGTWQPKPNGGHTLVFDNQKNGDEAIALGMTWSIANIQVIPEPGHIAMAIGVFVFCGVLALRRRL